MTKTTKNANVVSWLLRVGLAAVFVYAALSSLWHPLLWVGFLPAFLTSAISSILLIKLFAVYELGLAGWLLSGKYLRSSALVCAVTLFGIVITNPSQLITTFRDVGLSCMALALYFTQT